jgi:hypothetical protein
MSANKRSFFIESYSGEPDVPPDWTFRLLSGQAHESPAPTLAVATPSALPTLISSFYLFGR